jgi:hypothetical protein
VKHFARSARANSARLVLAVFVAWLSARSATAQPCTLNISPAFPGGDFYDGPLVMREFDADGLPQLVVAGGTLRLRSDGAFDTILRWNGSQWGSLGTGLNGAVADMLVWDVDAAGPIAPALFVGGFFTTAGGIPALGIAKWDGNSWQALAPGPPYMAVYAMTIHDADGVGPQLPALVVVGSFPAFAGPGSANIARWNGTTWSAVQSSTPSGNYLSAVTSYDADAGGPALPTLVVIENNVYNRVIRLANSNWTVISTGDIFPTLLATFDPEGPALPELIVGGHYSYPGVPGGAGVVRWNGTTWSAIDGGITTDGASPGNIARLDVFDPDGAGPLPNSLFVSGEFSFAGSLPAANLARWDGTAWNAAGSPNAGTYSVARFDPDGAGPEWPQMVISGEFTSVEGPPASHIAIYTPTGWQALGSASVGNGLSDSPKAVEYFDGAGPQQPRLVVGGYFRVAGTQSVGGLAVLHGNSWTAPPFNFSGSVYALKATDFASAGTSQLYIGGNGLYRWDGVALAELEPAVAGAVNALELFDRDGAGPRGVELIVGGSFPTIGSVPNTRYLASWDGTSWSALGTGISQPVRAMCAIDLDADGPNPPVLIVGGQSTITRWDGASWSTIGSPVGIGVFAMAAFDEDGEGPAGPALYVGGRFTRISGTDLSNIARWDGAVWSPLDAGTSNYIETLTVHDFDGGGPELPQLVVGGRFSHVNNQPLPYLALWNGATWSVPPVQPNSIVLSTASLPGTLGDNPTLVLGGWFNDVSGTPSERFALIACNICSGDIDGDHDVDLQDLAILLANFGQLEGMGAEDGDLDSDADVDLADLTLMLSHFAQPC